MKRVKIGLILALVVLALLAVIQNAEEVSVDFLWMTAAIPLAALLLLTLTVGVALGLLSAFLAGGRRGGPEDEGSGSA